MAKRLLCVLLSVLMVVAMLPTGVFADVESVTYSYSESPLTVSKNWGVSSISGTTVAFSSQWGEAYVNFGASIDLSLYDTLAYTVSNVTGEVQLVLYYTDGTYSYPGSFTADGTYYTSVASGNTLSYFELQDCEGGSTVTLDTVVLSDSNGENESLTCTYQESDLTLSTNWGSSVSGNTATFTSQWGEVYINLPSTVDYSLYNTVTYTVSDVSGSINLVVYYSDGTSASYFSISGDGTFSVSLAGTVSYMEFQYTESDTGTISLSSMTLSYVTYSYWEIEDVQLGGSGWNSSYDATTSTITFTGEGGRGWWFGTDSEVELGSVTVETDNALSYTLVVEYTDGSDDTSVSSDESGTATATLDSSAIKQIYIYSSSAGELEITNVTYELPSEDVLPSFYGKTLSLGGQIGVNFYVDFTDVDGADDYYVTFTVGDGTSTDVYSSGTDSNGYYKYTCSVPCWEMGTTIKAVLTNGETVADTCEYSVETYANNMQSYSTALGNLVTAMLEYGNCAATYNTQSTTVDDVAGNIEDVIADDLAEYKAVVEDEADASMLEAYLSLYYSCDLSFELTGDYTMTIDGVETDTIEDILVQNWDKTYNIVIYKDDEAVCSLTYSVLSYAYTVVANSDDYDVELVDLVKSMYLYNVAADAYNG